MASTAEIEALKLLGTEPMRGGTRLFYVAGGRLRRLLATHHERTARFRQLLGASDEELAAAVAAKLDQLREAQRAVRASGEELAAEAGRALAAGAGRVAGAHWEQRDLPFLQQVARSFVTLAPDRLALLTAGPGEEGCFLLCAGAQLTLDLTALGREVAGILAGRGGGAGRAFQGKATALSHRGEALAKLRAFMGGG